VAFRLAIILLLLGTATSLLLFFGVHLFLLFFLVLSFVAHDGVLRLLLFLDSGALPGNPVVFELLLLEMLQSFLLLAIDRDVAQGDHICPRLHFGTLLLQSEALEAACVEFIR